MKIPVFLTPEARRLNFFGRSQFRAAGPRIAIALFSSCRNWLFRYDTEVTLLIPFAEGIFHNAVFQRMKTDDHYPPTWFQDPRRRFQQRLQIVQFTVYEDSESLKSSRRGMNSSFCLIHWPGRGRYYLRKMRRTAYRPRPTNGSGDSPRPPFLSKFVNHVGKLSLVEVVYHLFGGTLRVRVHPHIERPFRLKTESTRSVIKLQAAHSNVGQNPVHATRLLPLGDFRE